MAEYIEREAAVQQCKRHDDYTAWSIKDGIEAIPAADVVPVVRCKECLQCTKSKWCDLLMMDVKDEHFCSYGERRDGE